MTASAILLVGLRVVHAAYLNKVPMGPPDAILGLAQAFRESTSPQKVNLVVGAYRDGQGRPWVLPSVRTAEARLLEREEPKEYAGIAGLPTFVKRALAFAYGPECEALDRIAGVQTLSGTGACRLAADFYARFLPAGTIVFCSDPTWPNHIPIFQQSGLTVKRYRYLERTTNRLDLQGMLTDISTAPDGSVFVVHACAHNPTGVDPTTEEWVEISDALLRGGHHVLVDMAYQGFASGDSQRDAGALRTLVSAGHSLLLAQSFAKNFGLYGERVGTLSAVCADAEEVERIQSQLKLLIRPMYSNPPIHGALLVSEVLGDESLRSQYDIECASMATRIQKMRLLLRREIEAAGSTHGWSHVTDQIGMFAFTGMNAQMCDELMSKHSIFLTRDGRISLAGINNNNVEYVARAIHDVTNGRALGETA
eukprot:CAMPEP_0119302312 /NCGR_PEP_ID=MMETSP1333-20130426/3927_1 /TAXON_ID=418940 /ORGANISM="Scyphosphaera apsteinii, Strain RCC1455" /LENGTH=422 /DNA_ID=CAMNT_0007304625 /DNA_START=32 /DNA_END=1300 /DNA_ORIENTATION=-